MTGKKTEETRTLSGQQRRDTVKGAIAGYIAADGLAVPISEMRVKVSAHLNDVGYVMSPDVSESEIKRGLADLYAEGNPSMVVVHPNKLVPRHRPPTPVVVGANVTALVEAVRQFNALTESLRTDPTVTVNYFRDDDGKLLAEVHTVNRVS